MAKIDICKVCSHAINLHLDGIQKVHSKRGCIVTECKCTHTYELLKASIYHTCKECLHPLAAHDMYKLGCAIDGCYCKQTGKRCPNCLHFLALHDDEECTLVECDCQKIEVFIKNMKEETAKIKIRNPLITCPVCLHLKSVCICPQVADIASSEPLAQNKSQETAWGTCTSCLHLMSLHEVDGGCGVFGCICKQKGNPKEGEEILDISPSGATSRSAVLDYTLTPMEAIDAITHRFMHGVDKGHARYNWQTGKDDAVFIQKRMNHALKHLLRVVAGTGNFDDVEATMCNLAMICWWRKNGTGLKVAFPKLFEKE